VFDAGVISTLLHQECGQKVVFKPVINKLYKSTKSFKEKRVYIWGFSNILCIVQFSTLLHLPPLDSTMSGFESRAVDTFIAVRNSELPAKSHPPELNLILIKGKL